LNLEDMSLKGLVNSIEQNFAHVAEEKGLYLMVNLADGLPATIRTDRQQVEQIVKHLLSNAFKFTEQGSVSVRLARPAAGVELSHYELAAQNAIAIAVADTGIGIPKDKQREIFEAFQPADGMVNRKYGGIGLGLAISRGLAKLLGGEIQVHSEEGRGSTFTLYLPETLQVVQADSFPDVRGEPAITSAVEEISAPIETLSVPSQPGSGLEEQAALTIIEEAMIETVKNVLIVENDGLTLMRMVELLSVTGVEITTAETGQDAYRQLQTTKFDGMILDLSLTDISAFELLDLIEEDPLIKPLPIIVYTDQEFTGEQRRLLQQYTKSPLKEVNSPEQMLDEITVFLEQAESESPSEHQQNLRIFHGKDPVLDQKTILVIDNVRESDSLTNVLQEKGLQVLLAGNEEEALQQLDGHPEINLVLMDIMLPEMNGYDVMRRIRRDTRFMKVPIIALTAKAMEDDRQKCLEAGVNDYLSKPVDADELLSLLRVWLY
jgi:CheY-like chemotaxis protein